MRIRPVLPVLLFCASIAAHAANITTDLFSVDIPDQWKIEDDKASTVLAFGNTFTDGMPSPFLSIQYCITGTSAGKARHNSCNQACSDAAINLTSDIRLPDARFVPVEKTHNGDGSIQYVSALSPESPVAGQVALSCSDQGQVYMSLVSSRPEDDSKELFFEILKSLKWK